MPVVRLFEHLLKPMSIICVLYHIEIIDQFRAHVRTYAQIYQGDHQEKLNSNLNDKVSIEYSDGCLCSLLCTEYALYFAYTNFVQKARKRS